MTKAELIAAVARECHQTKRATDKMLEVLFSTIAASVEMNGRFMVPGFGVFYLSTRKARRIRNPATNELMELPESRTVRFRASKRLKADQ